MPCDGRDGGELARAKGFEPSMGPGDFMNEMGIRFWGWGACVVNDEAKLSARADERRWDIDLG